MSIQIEAIIVCGVFCCYTAIRNRTIIHPLVLFNAIWCVILFLDSLKLYELNGVEDRIYKYILAGILSFNIGNGVWFRIRSKYSFQCGRPIVGRGYSSLRNDLVYIMGIVCIAYYVIPVIDTLSTLVAGGTLATVRESVQNSESVTSLAAKILNALSVLIIVPFAQAIPVVSVTNYWFGNKDARLLLIGAVLAAMSSLGEGGRTALVNFVLYIVVCLFIRRDVGSKGDHRLSHKQWRIVIVGTMLIGGLLVWATVSRSGMLLWKNLYLYFSMEPYMFNAWANRVDEAQLYGLGEAALNGFTFVPLYLVKNIIGLDFPVHWKAVYDMIRLSDSEWITITAQSTHANAYVSAFWFFYIDGRIIGIIIGFALYGIYLAECHRKMMEIGDVRRISIFCYLVQGLAWTFIRFPFSNIYYCIAFIYLQLVVFKISPHKERYENV